MRPNKLRQLLDEGRPTLGTRVQIVSPDIVELLGHTGMYDYVEFLAEYGPAHQHDLDNFCRASELYGLQSVIKVDQEPRGYLAQRGIGAGFQGVLFTDCRSTEDVRQCVRLARPETPEDGGLHGVGARRFAFPVYGGTPEYVQALREVVVMIMIEKRGAVEELEQILSVPGVDMIQWGPADYSMSAGMAGRQRSPEVKATERLVFETAIRMGIPPRAEIVTTDQARYYLDMGVRHFNLSTDVNILYGWWKANGEDLRRTIEGA